MRTLRPIVAGIAATAALGAGGWMARTSPPKIEGNYVLESRELPDGKTLHAPDVIGMLTLTKDRRNFNVYWLENGKPVSLSVISRYTISEKEYTEENVYYMMNDSADGKEPTYDTTSARSAAPVTVKGDEVKLTFPLHGEPDVVFDRSGMTATRKGAFVDHWKKVD